MSPDSPQSPNSDDRGAVALLVFLIGSCLGMFFGVLSFLLLNSRRTRTPVAPETPTEVIIRGPLTPELRTLLAAKTISKLVYESQEPNPAPRLTKPVTATAERTSNRLRLRLREIDRQLALFSVAVKARTAFFTDPVVAAVRRIQDRLMKIRVYRLYGWAVIPLLVVFTLQLNNHMYYDLFLSYDMPQHANNTFSIMNTGMMPPPPLRDDTYEAHQAPLFYIVTAWVMLIGQNFVVPTFVSVIPAFLLIWAMAWAFAVVMFVQNVLRRTSPILRGLTACVVLLFPMNTIITVMFSNDIGVITLGAVAAMILWYMTRSGRQLDPAMWLRAAAVSGLAIAFKSNGIALLGSYLALAAYIGLTYLIKGQFRSVARLALIAGIGVPMMVVPYMVNTYHQLRYLDNPFGSISSDNPPFVQAVKPSFFTTFDTDLFNGPFAYNAGDGPGDKSFWSMQYVTLHSDFYNHWNSKAYFNWPDTEMMTARHRQDMPIEHWNDAVLLEYLAIPITLVMVFGFCYSLYRVIWKRKYALRDGSVVVVIFTLVAQAEQYVRFAFDADVGTIIARYIGFLYAFLFIIGILSLWKVLHRRGILSLYVLICLNACMAYYAFIAMKFMWLPPI